MVELDSMEDQRLGNSKERCKKGTNRKEEGRESGSKRHRKEGEEKPASPHSASWVGATHFSIPSSGPHFCV